MTKFRPYYAFMRVKYNKDKSDIKTEIEKCYVDSPDDWSEDAKEALKAKGISF
jgi:hypothetical protein